MILQHYFQRPTGRSVAALSAGILWALGANTLAAQETAAQSDTAGLIEFFQNNPDHRPARWAVSQLAFQAGRYDIADYHIRRLLRTTTANADLQTLKFALVETTAADPWDYGLSFAVLPSNNIRRYTYNDTFETELGVFRPVGGGEEESGIGISVGADLLYTFGLPDQSLLQLNARVNHNLHDTSDLDQTQLLFSANREIFGLGHSTTFAPHIRLRYDDKLDLDRRDLGLNIGRSYWLEDDALFSVSALIENRDYILDNGLSGPYARSRIYYGYDIGDDTRLGFGLALARSEPQRGHLQYWEAEITANASRSFDDVGIFGVFGTYSLRLYDDIFPATSLVREDETSSLGVSYQHSTLKIFGSHPKITCEIERNSSNIALYDYAATDCSLTFERSF